MNDYLGAVLGLLATVALMTAVCIAWLYLIAFWRWFKPLLGYALVIVRFVLAWAFIPGVLLFIFTYKGVPLLPAIGCVCVVFLVYTVPMTIATLLCEPPNEE